MADVYNQSLKHKRLIDYVVVVGVRQPSLDKTETPELLRRFPQKDHEDFPLPADVVFFCQPEACNTVCKKFSLREANSFVFTLTEKDTGKIRYGVCMNIYRPCANFLYGESNGNEVKESCASGKKRRKSGKHKREICMTLTSLCIVSHHPFFSTFRECLFFLRKLIDTRVGEEKFDKNDNFIPGLHSWSVLTCSEDPKISPLAADIEDVETWVQRLLQAPSAIPGRTRVEVELLPPSSYPPLSFALPESYRFPLIDFPVHIPFELLGVETCLKVLTCILLEHKIVFQSRDYNALTMTIMALTKLMYPLEYMFPIIPLLPTCMNNAEQLLLAPTPYVIGVPASFFRYKSTGFQMPGDVWIVDLDSNKITVPLTADELPPLPEPEGSTLIRQLKMALQTLSMSPQTVANLKDAMPHDDIPPSDKINLEDLNDNNFIFGNDVDAVDVAVRVAMVKFFMGVNVAGKLSDHTRTLRLYSRPVVALQKASFLRSRVQPTEFAEALSNSQALEYFGECSIFPINTAYLKILKGMYDPQIIGDKSRWYGQFLETVHYRVFDEESSMCAEPWLEVDYEPTLIFDEDEATPNNDEDDDSSSCYSSVSDLVAQMVSGEINGATPTGSQHPPFAPVRASSPLADIQVSFSTPDSLAWHGTFLSVPEHGDPTVINTRVANGDTAAQNDSATGSLSEDSYSIQDEETEELMYSVSNPPSPDMNKVKKSSPGGDASDGEHTIVSDNSSQISVSTASGSNVEKANRILNNGTEAMMGLLSSIKKTTINVAKPISEDSDPSAAVNGYAKKMSDLSTQLSTKLTQTIQETERSFFPFPGTRQSKGSLSGKPSLTKQSSLEKTIQNENQQFLKDLIRNVMRGDGIGWLNSKKLQRLMTDESLRQMVVNRLYTAPSADRNTDMVEDTMFCHPAKGGPITQDRQLLDLLKQKLKWTLSSLSLGWPSASNSSARSWGTGDLSPPQVPEPKRISRYVYKGMLDILKAVVIGFEHSVKNSCLGGVATAFQFLEIAHTHYHGRDIKEDSMRVRDDDELSVTSNTESVLSDLSSELAIHSETEKKKKGVNGESDRDSGHWETSDGSSDIETLMKPSSASETDRAVSPDLPRSNSDTSSLLKRQDSDLKPRIRRSISETLVDVKSRLDRDQKRENTKSPTLAHMKLGHSRNNSADLNNERALPPVAPPSPLLRKSNLSKGYRYCNGDVIPVEDDPKRKSTGRRYLFEGLLRERSPIWDNMDFWESIYLDSVATEREAVGMDQGPAEMIDRYRSLGPAEQKRLEEDEDRLLATMLYNLVSFMVALDLDKVDIKRKVRRLLGKSHIGLLQSQQVNDLLDNLHNLSGNDIDLKPAGSRQMRKHSFVVHSGSTMNGDVYFMEVCDDCILLRAGTGTIVERWWYEKLVNITYAPKTKVLCIWARRGEDTLLSKFCTKKCKALYYCIKESMQRASERLRGKDNGPQLEGEFPIQDLSTSEGGLLQVTLEGIGLKFSTRRVHIDLSHIRNCSTQKGVFVLDEYITETQETVQHRFSSPMCNEICYAVLCLFSYVAASRNTPDPVILG